MTQDEIIEIATQVYGKCVWHESAVLHLEAFAKLVAKKEREACAELCDDQALGAYWEGADACANRIRTRGQA